MFLRLLLAFTLIPLVELFLLLYVAHAYLGLPGTIALVLTTGFLGAMLARQQGLLVWRNIQQAMQAGRMPTDELLHGLCTLAGGLMLLTPGILTDAAGFALLLPPSRAVVVALLKRWFKGRVSFVQTGFPGPTPMASGPAPIKDAEDVVISDDEQP